MNIENHGILQLLELDEEHFITMLEKKLHDIAIVTTFGKSHHLMYL